jgi:hypothetical protein
VKDAGSSTYDKMESSMFLFRHMGHSTSIQQILEKSVALNIPRFCTTLNAKSVVPSELACAF